MKVSASLLVLASGQTTIGQNTGLLEGSFGTAGTAPIMGCSLEDSVLACSPGWITVDVPVCAMEALGFANEAEVHEAFSLGNQWDTFCTHSSVTEYGEYHFFADHGACGISTSSNETHIFYEGTLRGAGGFNNGIISRERVFELNLRCDFSRESTVSIDGFFTPISRIRFELFSWLFVFNDLNLSFFERPKLGVCRTGYNRQPIQSCDEFVYRRKLRCADG